MRNIFRSMRAAIARENAVRLSYPTMGSRLLILLVQSTGYFGFNINGQLLQNRVPLNDVSVLKIANQHFCSDTA